MKKIATWKVIVFTLISAGLYSLVWFARSRDAIVEKYKDTVAVPRWLWLLVIPIIYAIGFFAMLGVYLAAYAGALSAESVTVTSHVIVALLTFVPVALAVWWFWYFGKVMEVVLRGRVPRWLTIVLIVVIGPFLAAVYQHYINRLDEGEKTKTHKPSVELLTLTSIFSVLFVLGSIMSVYSYFTSVDMVENEIVSMQANLKEVRSLEVKYNNCSEALNVKYPEQYIDEDKLDAYNTELAECNDLYKEYEEAFDRYINSI